MALGQKEADELLAMEKRRVDNQVYEFPDGGGRVSIPLASADGREEFLLDVYRGRIDLKKATYQNRARNIEILARLDISGRPHTNPDGEHIETPHLHLYREGYADKWAQPVPVDKFSDLADLWQSLEDFMGFVNVTAPPNLQRILP